MPTSVHWPAAAEPDALFRFTLAAFYLFFFSVPLTHSCGLIAHCPRDARLRHLLLYPARGGRYHSILQFVAWLLWTCAGLLMLPQAVWQQPDAAHLYHDLLPRCAAVGAVFAELFMIKSLLTFDPDKSADGSEQAVVGLAADASAALLPLSPRYVRTHLPTRTTSALAVLGMGGLWLATAGGLLAATGYIQDTTTKQVYYLFAGLSLLCGVTTTHGIGAKLLLSSGQEQPFAVERGWRFFQPFEGGTAFVAVQAFGWAAFSAALLGLFWLASQAAAGVAAYLNVATGSVMVAAQVLLCASIFSYQLKETQQSPGGAASIKAAAQRCLAVWLPMLVLYTPVQCLLTACCLSYGLLPAHVATALWVGCSALYLLLTAPGQPAHTGWREWPAFQQWMQRNLPLALAAWMGQVDVVQDVGEDAGQEASQLRPEGRYVLGYVPHGLFPIGAAYLPLLPGFREQFAGFRPITLIASVCFWTPVIRDFCSWCGVRQVSRRTVLRALRDRGAVVIVPGGQAELVHTWRFHARREFVVHTRHKGFVRLALQQRAALVPVVAIGEVGALRNFVDLPRLQAWTYKKLGFPIPYLVVGRWRFSPLPEATPLRFVVGRALHAPALPPGAEIPEELVDRLHGEFYQEVHRLFYKHRQQVPGYDNVELVFTNA